MRFKTPCREYLTDEDIRFEFHVMVRWCRLYKKTDCDWVDLAAARFRVRHPIGHRAPVELAEITSHAA